MKCLICHNNISHNIKCLLCLEKFCSYNCMESHILIAHNKKIIQNIIDTKNNLNKGKIQYNLTNEENEKKVLSPYLIPGILNIKRSYDQKYNLNNFIPVLENGKPRIIGFGSFGQVFLVMNRINKKYYAIKHMEKKALLDKLDNLDGIYKEIYIQSRIDHPNILPILYVNETISDFDLVLEFAVYGNLFHFIRNNKALNEPLSFSLFIQVVNAVYFLHKNNLIHRDIKPENILLFENNVLKLCDFGWCVKLEEGQQRDTFCGTTEYMSPELVNHEEYSKEIDVWSLGILLYEMIHGYSPFRPDKPNFEPFDVMDNIRMHKLKFKKNVSEECKELIYHLLDENPYKRIKVEDIFNSNFVKYYENMKFGLPDKYLIEKYKFKLAKLQNQNNIFLNINNNNYNIENKNKRFHENNENINLSNNFDSDNLKILIENKIKNKYDIFPLSLSETNLLRKNEKSLKTNNYFFKLNDEYKINNINSGRNKSKSNNKKNNQNYQGKKIKTIIINNYFQNNQKNNVRTENQNNDNFINIEINNEEQNNNIKKKYKIKPLKMNKIPINSKNHHVHSPSTNIIDLNSIINKNIIFKKNTSTKKANYKINKSNSFKKNKNNNGPKIIEIVKTKFSRSPKLNMANILNNKIKKSNTRNNLKTQYDTAKLKYNSDENITNTNNTNNSGINNIFNNKDDFNEKKLKINKLYYTKSLAQLKRKFDSNIKSIFFSNYRNNINNNNSINSENKKNNNLSLRIKINKNEDNLNNIRRIHTSMERSPKNNNIKSYNNIYIFKNFNRDKKKKYRIFKDILSPNISYNFTKNNSFSYNNNYINKSNIEISNLNKSKQKKNKKKVFSKEKLLKLYSPIVKNNNIELKKYKLNSDNESLFKNKNNFYYENKINKQYNSNGFNSIFKPVKKNQKETLKLKNNTNLNIVKSNTKIIEIKKAEIPNKNQKNDMYEKNKYKSNNNIISSIKPNIFILENEKIKNDNNSTRTKYKNIILNNEEELKKKNKQVKKLDINEFLSNIKLNRNKKNIPINIDTNNNLNYNCNTSFNQKKNNINTSINEKKYEEYFKNNKYKLNIEIDTQNNTSGRMNKNSNNKNSFCSRNYNKEEKYKQIVDNFKSPNSKSIQIKFNDNKTLNLDNKKIIIRNDSKIIISPISHKYKKDININNNNNKINRNENLNYINKSNFYLENIPLNKIEYQNKNKLQHYQNEYKCINDYNNF